MVLAGKSIDPEVTSLGTTVDTSFWGIGSISTPFIHCARVAGWRLGLTMSDQAPTESNVLNFEEATVFLRVSRPTLLELVKRKQVPARQVGAQWRFYRPALLDWLSGNDRASHSRRKS